MTAATQTAGTLRGYAAVPDGARRAAAEFIARHRTPQTADLFDRLATRLASAATCHDAALALAGAAEELRDDRRIDCENAACRAYDVIDTFAPWFA